MKHKSIVENVAKIIFTVCAVVAIFAVLSITIYMFLEGAPAFFKVGVLNLISEGSHSFVLLPEDLFLSVSSPGSHWDVPAHIAAVFSGLMQ